MSDLMGKTKCPRHKCDLCGFGTLVFCPLCDAGDVGEPAYVIAQRQDQTGTILLGLGDGGDRADDKAHPLTLYKNLPLALSEASAISQMATQIKLGLERCRTCVYRVYPREAATDFPWGKDELLRGLVGLAQADFMAKQQPGLHQAVITGEPVFTFPNK